MELVPPSPPCYFHFGDYNVRLWGGL